MNGKTLLALIGGFAAGVATGAYLASEKGSNVRKTLDEVLNDLGKEVDTLFSEGRGRMSQIAGDFIEGGREVKKELKRAGKSSR